MSDRQILALGSGEFVNRYSDKFGSSTAAMCDAFTIYGESVKRLNDAALKKKPVAAVKALRTRLSEFRNEMCSIGRCFSGGGTMWNIAYSETLGDVEDMIAHITGVKTAKPPARVVSDAAKLVDEVEKTAKAHAKEIESYKETGGGMPSVKESLKKARAEYKELIKIAAKRPRRESDAILDFCVNAAKIPMDQFGDELP